MMSRKSTTMKLALGLVSLTISLLLAAEFIGLLPDRVEVALEARKKVVELIAVQVATEASRNNVRSVETILSALVERDDKVLSAALRRESGEILVVVGDHEKHWQDSADGRSTATHVQVPIMKDDNRWGVVELSFMPLRAITSLKDWKESSFALLIFISVTGFLFFFFFLRRSLKELDPSTVIPEHVKSAFNALAEGVLIMDEDEQIVLANDAFGKLFGVPPADLVGHMASGLDWLQSQTDDSTHVYPWQLAMKERGVQTGVTLRRQSTDDEVRIYVVNGAPILDGAGKVRGALATFDDISEVERKNEELQVTLKNLANSKDEVKRQNKELRFLASRDPLTSLLNRRALFDRFERRFVEAKRDGTELSTIMIDIDHFKSVNDRYGHSAGDKVIKFVGKTLMSVANIGDLAARYGGEEFCLVLPGRDLEDATSIAELLRKRIHEDFDENFSSSVELTISLGVACLDKKVDSTNTLLNRADHALYTAKAAGRNRVVRWGDPEIAEHMSGRSDPMADSAATQLVPKIDETQDMRMLGLSDRIIELDALIEEKSSELHRKHGFDELTGLPNRILFYDRVSQALTSAQREGNSVAILYLDIDLLERVDDLLGPVKGDELLRAATDRLSTLVHSEETLKMLGGGSESISISRLADNEFGIALTDLKNVESITWIIQRLFECLSEAIEVDGKELFANTNIGISLYPGDGDDVETLMRCASTARHHAHADLGHNQYRFYADQMNERSYQQIRMQSQLREAIERNEFVLFYQPEVDLQTGRSVSMEALIRWEHPDMGLIGPDMFIPNAEQSGIIVEIGDWVMRAACTQMKEWLEDGLEDIRVAVNLSAVQLQSDQLADNIIGILDEVGLKPKYLELEITETALMENVDKIDQSLQKLRKKGVHIAIDDFGTGFSSLSHLKRLVVDCLKIDRSFTRDVTTNTRDAALVGAIITMAQNMHLRVVAEGVETEKQLTYLRNLNCDLAQGYLLSEPVPAAEATSLLKDATCLLPALGDSSTPGDASASVISKDFPKRKPAPKVTDVVESRAEKV